MATAIYTGCIIIATAIHGDLLIDLLGTVRTFVFVLFGCAFAVYDIVALSKDS